MATILKAGNVATGAQITSDATGILEIRTGTGAGTTAITVGTDQAVTMGAVSSSSLTVNSNNISAVNSLGFRNRIINGAMVIDQRNNGASVTITDTSANTYTLDRWASYTSASSKFSVQQSSTAPTGFANSLLVTSLAATSVGSSDRYYIGQFIEGFNTADLGWGTANATTVTLSFWVRSSLTGTFGGTLMNSANNRNYPFTYSISSANTWEYKTITVAGDTTGTWIGSTNGVGIRVFFGLGVGSSASGTAGAWGAGNYNSATGATSVVGTNGATFYITGVQLEAGSVATPFERRDYGRELMMCQRYYQVQASGSYVFAGRSSSTTAVLYSVPLQVAMRASPTLSSAAIIAYGPTSANLSSGGASTVITFGTNSLVIQRTGYTGITDDRCYNGYLSTDPLTLSSEL
jgi:hypothetical protein